jgi:L-arabinokinase
LSDFYTRFEKLLPEKLSGKDFLNQFRETSDLYAKIDPESVFSIRICTQHPIAEHQRTKQFKLLLEYSALTQNVEKRERIMESMGELMFQSHASYSACGLGHPKTNELVEMVRQNLGSGVFGAKITGGGSGGTVCVLSDNRQGGNTVSHIHNQYQEKLGRSVLLIKP